MDVSKENPVINVKLNLTAEVLNTLNKPDLSYSEILDKLDEALKQYLSKEFKDYLYKTSKQYQVDINEFYRIARTKFLTTGEFNNYNWAEKYQNAKFNVDFSDKIISTIIIQQN